MTSDDSCYLLTTIGINETQDQLLLEAIKKNAESWWHELVGIWIIRGGGSFHDWSLRISLICSLPKSAYLLLALPELGMRQWTGRLPAQAFEWIHHNYAAPNGKVKRPLPPPKNPFEDEPPPPNPDEPPF